MAAALERLLEALAALGVGDGQIDAVAERLATTFAVADQRPDRDAVAAQPGDEAPADEPVGAGDGDGRELGSVAHLPAPTRAGSRSGAGFESVASGGSGSSSVASERRKPLQTITCIASWVRA